jgi:hypothetical protein
MSEEEAIPLMVVSSPGTASPREELKQSQCAYCCKEGHWKNECPQEPMEPQKAPQTRGIDWVITGKFSLLRREAASGGRHLQAGDFWGLWGGLEWTRLYFPGPPGAYGSKEGRGQSHYLLMNTGMTHLVVTQLVGPWEIRLAAPSSYPENAILESMK